MVARNLQKLSLLSDGVRWDNFCKYPATMKFQLLSYKKWTLSYGIFVSNIIMCIVQPPVHALLKRTSTVVFLGPRVIKRAIDVHDI